MISIFWENIPTFIISYKKYKIEKRYKNLYESKRHDE